MNIIIEFIFIKPELNEMKNNINKTIKEYIKKYDNGYWKRLEYKYNIRFLDKIKNKTKNIWTKCDPKRNIQASNQRYEFMEINIFIILIEGVIKKML